MTVISKLEKIIGSENISDVSYTSVYMTVRTHFQQTDSAALFKRIDMLGAEILQRDGKVFIRKKRVHAIPLGLRGLYYCAFAISAGIILWYNENYLNCLLEMLRIFS